MGTWVRTTQGLYQPLYTTISGTGSQLRRSEVTRQHSKEIELTKLIFGEKKQRLCPSSYVGLGLEHNPKPEENYLQYNSFLKNSTLQIEGGDEAMGG